MARPMSQSFIPSARASTRWRRRCWVVDKGALGFEYVNYEEIVTFNGNRAGRGVSDLCCRSTDTALRKLWSHLGSTSDRCLGLCQLRDFFRVHAPSLRFSKHTRLYQYRREVRNSGFSIRHGRLEPPASDGGQFFQPFGRQRECVGYSARCIHTERHTISDSIDIPFLFAPDRNERGQPRNSLGRGWRSFEFGRENNVPVSRRGKR